MTEEDGYKGRWKSLKDVTWADFFKAGGFWNEERERWDRPKKDPATNQHFSNRTFARKCGFSTVTLATIFNAPHSARPTMKGEKKYFEKLEETEGYKKWFDKFREKLKGGKDKGESQWNTQKTKVAEAFSMLHNKNPEDWTAEDYATIRKWLKERHLKRQGTELVSQQDVAPFHNLMKANGHPEYFTEIQADEVEKGKKKEFFLNDKDIWKLLEVYAVEDPKNDLLILMAVGLNKGARVSSLELDIPLNYKHEEGFSDDFEPKVTKRVRRYLIPEVMELVKRYVEDCGLKENEKIFPDSYSNYLARLQRVAFAAHILKPIHEKERVEMVEIGTHIFKHTFVTQAIQHGVPAESVSEQVHTELRTLEAHYLAKDPEKQAHHFSGKPMKERETFVSWLGQFFDRSKPNNFFAVYEKNCVSDDRCRRKTA